MQCSKQLQHSMRNVGKTHKTQCNKPVYKNGLCSYHYNRMVEKSKNWGDRKNYRLSTEADLQNGRCLKLKDDNVNHLFKCIKGKIHQWNKKLDKYVETDIDVDTNLFVVHTN